MNYYTLKLNYSICDTDNKNLDGVVSKNIDAPFIQEKIMDKVKEKITPLKVDRYFAPDVETAKQLLLSNLRMLDRWLQ